MTRGMHPLSADVLGVDGCWWLETRDDLQWSNENGEETKWPDISGKRYQKMPLGHFTLSLFGCNWVWHCETQRILWIWWIVSRHSMLPSPGKLPLTWVWMFSSTGIPHAPQGKPRVFGWDIGTSTERWWPMGMANGVSKWLWLYHVIPCYTMLYHVIPCYTMLYLSPRHGQLYVTMGKSG